MPNLILTDLNYYESVRRKLGVTSTVVSDADIDDIMCLSIAEANTINRIPDYKLVTVVETLYLKSAVICYIAYLLCSAMKVKHKIDVQTIDATWGKDKVDWDKMQQFFIDEWNGNLSMIDSVSTDGNVGVSLIGLAKSARSIKNAGEIGSNN